MRGFLLGLFTLVTVVWVVLMTALVASYTIKRTKRSAVFEIKHRRLPH